MINLEEIEKIISDIKYPGFVFHLNKDPVYIQIQCPDGMDNVTGEPSSWHGRKWFFSYDRIEWLASHHMLEEELVGTAWMATQAALIHEARELFKYKGRAIYGPHFSMKHLLAMCDDPTSIATRPNPENDNGRIR